VGADVRFAGLRVGQVAAVVLQPDGLVRVELDVDRETPVRADSRALVDSSGLTSVAFVAVQPGSADAPLVNDRAEPVELVVTRSTLGSLTEAAPQVLDQARQILEQVNAIFGPENQSRVANILVNLEGASGDLSGALDNFEQFTATVATATDTFATFTDNVAPLLLQAEKTIESLQFAVDEAALVATEARLTLEAGTQTLQTTDRFIAQDLTNLAAELQTGVREIRAEFESFSRQAQGMFDQFTSVGAAAETRLLALDPALARIEPMLAQAETTLADLGQVARNVDTLVTGDGAALVAEARVAVASIAAVAENDLPVIMGDIRMATAELRRVMETAGEDITNATGRIDTLTDSGIRTLDQVTETFASANVTLDAVNRALAVGEGTLQAAERAFEGADRVINEDVAQITADLRDVLARLGGAVDAVSADIPQVTADLRRTAESAARAFDEVGRMVQATSGPVRDFAATGLPNIGQLARETRTLIANLDRLTAQIQSDPTRFFLNRQTPEFRR
jgi:phospholipid/cholesterol/gamma-HCH transport system substrate-binding protein